MTVPKITKLPPMPNRTLQPAQFVPMADAALGALPEFGEQVNASAEFVNAKTAETAASAQAAATARNAAQQAASQASTNGAAQVQLAANEVVKAAAEAQKSSGFANDSKEYRDSAYIAAAAAGSAAGLPSLVGSKGKTLVVNEAETAVSWGDALHLSTQAQATQGSDNTTAMTPLRTKQAIDSMAIAQMFGVGQSWQAVTRLMNVSYQNATGKPIAVTARTANLGGPTVASIGVSTDNTTWVIVGFAVSPYDQAYATAIVPAGHYYRIGTQSGGTLRGVSELR